MKSEIFIVMAYRNGDLKGHSYVVTYSKKESRAKHFADGHSKYRGRKYSCVVYKIKEESIIDLDSGLEKIYDTGCFLDDN